MQFLNAAAQLIDAALSADPLHLPQRLRALHYPAALEWIRLEDVLRVTRETQSPTASKKALTNRWPTKDEFIRDAVIHAMLYRDDPSADPQSDGPRLERILTARSVSDGVALVVDDLAQTLLGHPRSFLLAHIAPLLPRHPELADELLESSRTPHETWTAQYPMLLAQLGICLRPDWPPERVTLAVQIMLDGLMVRSRLEPRAIEASAWRTGSLFADMVLAFLAGAIDTGGDQQPTRAWLDARMAR